MDFLEIAKIARTDFGLDSLNVLAASVGVLGVSRLLVESHFEPRRVVTLTFTDDQIGVEVAGDKRTMRDGCIKESASVTYDENLEIFANWSTFLTWARKLESYERSMYDGCWYVHEILDGHNKRTVSWLNPEWVRSPQAMHLINTTLTLIKRAGLDHLLRKHHS